MPAIPALDRPGRPLTITTLLVVGIGVGLPYSPWAGALGFTPLPGAYFAFLVTVVGIYLLLVEGVKRRLLARLLQ